MRLIEPYKALADERGRFQGVLNQGTWEEFNYVETRAGISRGGHYHAVTDEGFYIVRGRVRVVVERADGSCRDEVTVQAGAVFIIEPGEVHTFHVEEDAAWLNFLSQKFDDEAPDIHVPKARRGQS